MPLSWDLTAIEKNKELCWIPATEEEGKFELHPVTHVLIWSTMLIGFSKITQKNYKDFHRRLIEFEVVTGNKMLSFKNADGVLEERQPSLQEIEDHIGLSTNVSVMTARQWTAYLGRVIKEEADRRIKQG